MDNEKSYHGYLGLPRHAKLLFHDLGPTLFAFHLMLVMSAVWFRGNSDFCYVKKTQSELADIFGCDQATISRNLARLAEKKYILRRTKHGMIRVIYLPLFLTEVDAKMYDSNYANMHELYEAMHDINAELQDKYAFVQGKRAQKTIQRL